MCKPNVDSIWMPLLYFLHCKHRSPYFLEKNELMEIVTETSDVLKKTGLI